MADRKAELERKRRKLEEMKKAREEKKKAEKAAASAGVQKASLPGPIASQSDIDKLLEDIDLPSSSTVVASPQIASQDSQSISSEDSKPTSPAPQRPVPKLSVAHLNSINVPPKEMVSYTKETQTIEVQPVEPEDDRESLELQKREAEKQEAIKQEKEEEKKRLEEKKEEVSKVLELSEEQRSHILSSQDFSQFFDKATRLVEKAICENMDICFDYGGSAEDAEGDAEAAARLSLNRKFYDERWSKHRCVTCMDWSSQYPELLVSSYNENESAPQDPDGVALVWNMKYNKTSPEYVFHNQSAVMSVCFANFHPNLIIGGTYSGQIVLWDNRSRKKTPVQKTPLSSTAHTHPVYSIDVVGTQNAHNLITASTDGRMCSWSLDMLAQPQETMDLQHKQSKAVSVTSMSFLSGDVNNFVVGSEDGSVYTGHRHGSKAGIIDQFDGHNGPVTGISYNCVPGQVDFSHLILTSSFDWTIKLWSNKSTKLLYSFEDNGDYIYDVQWSPIHPAVFAAVDGMGRLDLWNLNKDTEVPTCSVTIEPLSAINRVRWAASGHQIAVGDDDGHTYIYDVGEQLAVPRPDEWSRFVNTLQELQANQANLSSVELGDFKALSPSSYISPVRM
ncbi:cytoplasmic dynein 1 intermediate chain 2-like [Rhopilema esculentum]|uniref:cytoplasmic dynein 1 intermediate chain 2-like n=1 Tax=Rhopilema esculentum TaxID=499914 RepID=UPI0031E01451